MKIVKVTMSVEILALVEDDVDHGEMRSYIEDEISQLCMAPDVEEIKDPDQLNCRDWDDECLVYGRTARDVSVGELRTAMRAGTEPEGVF